MGLYNEGKETASHIMFEYWRFQPMGVINPRDEFHKKNLTGVSVIKYYTQY